MSKRKNSDKIPLVKDISKDSKTTLERSFHNVTSHNRSASLVKSRSQQTWNLRERRPGRETRPRVGQHGSANTNARVRKQKRAGQKTKTRGSENKTRGSANTNARVRKQPLADPRWPGQPSWDQVSDPRWPGQPSRDQVSDPRWPGQPFQDQVSDPRWPGQPFWKAGISRVSSCIFWDRLEFPDL